MKKISALFIAICLLVSSGAVCAQGGEYPAELPAHILDVFLKSGYAYYDIVSWLVAEESFAVLAIALHDQTMLVVMENLYGQWKETIAAYSAVYNTRTIDLARLGVGGAWQNDGFIVSYQNDYGNWPAFIFSREGQGQWTFNTLEFHDGHNVWRVERDFLHDYRYIFINDEGEGIQQFDAHHPFDGDLRSFDAYNVPTSLQEAKAMLGDTLRPITEAEILSPPRSTEPPASNNSMAEEIPVHMAGDEYVLAGVAVPMDQEIAPGLAFVAESTQETPIPLETPHPMPTPHWEQLHGVETVFPPDLTIDVYSGPGAHYVRGDGGNAYVSTNEPIVVYGHENGYILIEYRTNDGASRFGYIEKAYVPEGDGVRDLAFYGYPILLSENMVITDDPSISQRPLMTLSAQAAGRYLVTFGEWAYVETTDPGGNPVRGFVNDADVVFGYE